MAVAVIGERVAVGCSREVLDESVVVEVLADAVRVVGDLLDRIAREEVGVLVLEDDRVARFDGHDLPAVRDVVRENVDVRTRPA